MLKWLISLTGIDDFLEAIFNTTWARISSLILKWCETAIGFSTGYTGNFWTQPLIQGFLNFSRWVGVGMVAATTVLLIFDVVEDASRQKNIDYTMVFASFFKGLAFAIIAPEAGKYALVITNKMAGNLKISNVMLQTNLVESIKVKGNPVVASIIVGLACYIFLIVSLARFGTMFVQCLTPCLYVSDIIRGETAAMGSWIRQTVAIAITHLIETALFYLGVYFMTVDVAWLLSAACWIGMIQTKKVLDKYGMSCGVTGVVSSAWQVASTGINLATKLI